MVLIYLPAVFSFINSDELTSFFENVMNNAVGYAFTLAMTSVSPEMTSVYKWMEDLADRVNQTNMNSCETGAALVGGLWPKTAESQRQVCESIGTSSMGIFDDWASARQECGNAGQTSDTLSKGKDSEYKAMIAEGNIAWKVLQNLDYLGDDTELAELFMSLSGTVILAADKDKGSGDDAPHIQKVLASLASNNNLVNALLHGGEAEIYKCDTTDLDGCTSPTTTTIDVQQNDALENQVSDMLTSMVQKIQNDEALSDEEKGLLQSTSIPIYKILKVELALQKDAATLDIQKYSEVVATDILTQYLSESLDAVQMSLSTVDYPEEYMQEFQVGLQDAYKQVANYKTNAYQQVTMANNLVLQTEQEEQMLVGEFSSDFENNIQWARGMYS
ncbi:MAG: conjugal transfer protein TraH [Gammaproteobacteria bacterium]|nr:conjugal transfer protein TraH [Gammaproteobacteria bacterium]